MDISEGKEAIEKIKTLEEQIDKRIKKVKEEAKDIVLEAKTNSEEMIRKKENEIRMNLDIFEKKLNEVTKEACSLFIGEKKEGGIACLSVYPRSFHEVVERKVFGRDESNIESMHIPEKFEQSNYASTIFHLFKREKEANHELTLAWKKLHYFAIDWKLTLRRVENLLSDKIDRLRVNNYLALSGKTFWISGWTPDNKTEEICNKIYNIYKGKVIIYITSHGPNESADVPVMLRNPSWVKPF